MIETVLLTDNNLSIKNSLLSCQFAFASHLSDGFWQSVFVSIPHRNDHKFDIYLAKFDNAYPCAMLPRKFGAYSSRFIRARWPGRARRVRWVRRGGVGGREAERGLLEDDQPLSGGESQSPEKEVVAP